MTHTTVGADNRTAVKHIAVKKILIKLRFLLRMFCLNFIYFFLDNS